MKKIFKKAGFALLFLLIGAFIGGAIVGSAPRRPVERVVINERGPVVGEMIDKRIEEQIEIQVQDVERIVEEIVIEPDIRIPPIPEIPQLPDTQVRIVHQGPSFFDIVGGIANMLTAVLLIGIGIMVLVRRQRQPKEKQPQ
ncbi:MAG: hypothetical protein DWQ04_21560 [Chloroflexi bacterium]|nr:MAG: hypothetical protein DWQ04_21560 [Chloroflexota bacterium]